MTSAQPLPPLTPAAMVEPTPTTAQPAAPTPAAGAEPIISANGLSRAYGDRMAVSDMTFDVLPGTILGVVGPSGSGKTTTIRMLTGTLSRTSGEVQVLGEDPMRFSRRARGRIAYMPQLFSLYEDLSAQENVGFVAALYGLGPFRRRGRIRRALEVVDLWDARHRLARDLSGGMQRRLELACALVHSPEVLFVDEPTAGIDPLLRQSIWDELRDLRNEGRTLVVTTQYVAEAEYCDRVALIVDGELVALDEPGALRQMVFGGDVLQVDTTRAVDPELLAGIGGVTSVRQTAPRQLMVTVEDAGSLTPQIIDALRAGGVEVAGIEEHQPTFDEVFAGLVEQRRALRGQTDLDLSERRGADGE
ncbi:MAG TPA: ABC transporter ATP-binding protein [Candidatus Limnocylindria bacterium]|nr:ABC transporter ATP-binding protein [Candidatus Limnocylindria bacterium]